MIQKRSYIGRTLAMLLIVSGVCLATITFFASASPAATAKAKHKTFTSPDEAVQALVDALRRADSSGVISVLGPGGKEVVSSGDAVADRQTRESFLKDFDESQKVERQGDDKAVLIIGKNDWPFPIPIVKKGDAWFFDTRAGKEEILNRRIGRNELYTIQTCLAIVDAQREYAMNDRDGDGLLEYAEKFASDPGKKNGLYWKTAEGEEPSPLGELVAKAKAEGYSRKGKKGNPIAYNGYYYRILKGQGKNAPGGAFDYVVNGHMIGGFAVVAYPATYGNSGVMTFAVNHDGVVYQKDLGRNTATVAKAMKLFDPDNTWKKAQ